MLRRAAVLLDEPLNLLKAHDYPLLARCPTRFILGLGFSLWLSAIDGLWRDLRHALPLLLQLGMFVSPVAYITGALVPEKWRNLYEWNPMVAPIEAFRWAVLGGQAPSGEALLKSGLVVATLLISGTIFFVRIQRTIVDRI